ncbi:Transporter [hydrothermal vent metagenome]|uniref:Transporter n=1 Tax=hydrothermal vent metagenome TaxID=652676 RepID=A0A1W1DGN2_9ZZZZ
MWTIAFQTGNYRGEVEKIIGEDIINIYVPTTPNPTSGFFIMLPKDDVIELDMSVDEAFKLIISTGVVTPN